MLFGATTEELLLAVGETAIHMMPHLSMVNRNTYHYTIQKFKEGKIKVYNVEVGRVYQPIGVKMVAIKLLASRLNCIRNRELFKCYWRYRNCRSGQGLSILTLR